MNGVAAYISRILIASAFGASAAIAPALAQPTALKLDAAKTEAQPNVIEAQSVSWGAATSDPQEGGEVVRNGGGHSMLGASDRKTRPGRPTYGNAVADNPAAAGRSGPSIGEIPITKPMDVSSGKLSAAPSGGGAAEPGKLEIPNLRAGAAANDPPPAGTATITVARGTCTSGQHLPEVKLHLGTRSFTLRDVDVGNCVDAGADSQTCTLTYASLGG